ncbi:hypothetical protein MauCBS54593_006598 [Microsporum audouinii]
MSYIIRPTLSAQNPIWGWVIYRCSYKNEKLWTNFLHEWNGAVQRSLSSPSYAETLKAMETKIVEDTSPEGASKEAICHRHFSWSQSLGQKLQDEYNDLYLAPRYKFAVHVDEGALQSAKDHPGPHNAHRGYSYANILHTTYFMDKEYALERFLWQKPVGNQTEKPYWMKCELETLPVFAYSDLIKTNRWYTDYVAPPRLWRAGM